jgi:hypothetical protein
VKDGKFSIAPAPVKIKNNIYKSNPLNLEVLKASSPAAAQNQSGSRDTEEAGKVDENDLFVRLVLDKKEAYLGEQIMATIKIYTKTRLAGIDQGFKGPDFTGFFTEPVETPPLRNLQREAVNGEIYNTGVLRRMVIIPQRSGDITIEAFELDVALRREIQRKFADPFFDDFTIPEVQEIPVKLKSRPIKVLVKPLPANAPSSFRGAVGNFRISSTLNKTETNVNEPLTLRVTLSGKGNLKLINDILVTVPHDMERYDPVINTRSDNAVSGSKTFEYLIMPRREGAFKIPPVEFTYFDAETEKYKSLQTSAYDVLVEKGEGDSLMAFVPGMNKEDVRLLNQDIRFIKTKPSRLNRINYFIAEAPWYYLLYILFLGLFLVFLSVRKKVIRQHADITGMRLRKADKYARKRLRKSEGLLKQGNDTAFYEEMLGALYDYLSHKLNIPVSSLSKDSARLALQTRGVDDSLIEELLRIIGECEIARYGHGTSDVLKENLYHDAVKIITTLQQKLR